MNKEILLAQTIKEGDWRLTNLESSLSRSFNSNIFCIDDKSDVQSMQYASQFIKESDKPTVIIWDHTDGIGFAFQMVLNALISKKNEATLLTNSTHPSITRIEKAINVKRVTKETEVFILLEEL